MGEGTWDNSFPLLLERTTARGSDINTRISGLSSNYDKLPLPRDDGEEGFHGPCAVGDAGELFQAPNVTQVINGAVVHGVDSGAANAYVVAMPVPSAAYVKGMRVNFVVGSTNTGVSTVNIDSLGVVSLKVSDLEELPADYVFENDVVEIVYTGSYFQIVSTAPHVASAANSATASASSATDSETSAAAAADSEIESAASEALSASSANFVGNWSDQTGAHVIPTSVAHSGAYWMLTTDIADITISEPGVSSDWLLIPNSYEQRVTDLGSVSGSEVINVSGSEVFKLAIAGAVDISFSNFKSDVHKTVMLVITGAASNITWSSAIKWAEGDAPSLSSGRDRIVFASEDAGVTIDAALCGSDFA